MLRILSAGWEWWAVRIGMDKVNERVEEEKGTNLPLANSLPQYWLSCQGPEGKKQIDCTLSTQHPAPSGPSAKSPQRTEQGVSMASQPSDVLSGFSGGKHDTKG